jgi:hypothetical protein
MMRNLADLKIESDVLESNPISIKSVRSATINEWDIIWRDCNYSTFFHSVEWAEIWSKYMQGKMTLAPSLVLFSDGKKALLPFSCLRRNGLVPVFLGTAKQYISSPELTYGGWISSDNLYRNHAVLLLNLIRKKFANLAWRVNPYDEVALQVIRNYDFDETHVINLEREFDEIAKSFSKGHRTAVKQAIRGDVSVRLASSPKDWLDYYKTYETSVNRWGKRLLGVKYSWDLFQEISRRCSPNIELWLAIHKNRVISGALCFHSKRHFVYWHGASIDTYFNLRPVNLLLYEVIRNACEKGYTWFDFNPSGGLKGVRAFKERFGAKALKCPVIRQEPINLRTFAIGKVSDKIIQIKKRTNCTISSSLFKRLIRND